MSVVDRPLNLVAAADTCDADRPLARVVARHRFRFPTCGRQCHIGEQVEPAGRRSVDLTGRRCPDHGPVGELFVAPAVIEGLVSMMLTTC